MTGQEDGLAAAFDSLSEYLGAGLTLRVKTLETHFSGGYHQELEGLRENLAGKFQPLASQKKGVTEPRGFRSGFAQDPEGTPRLNWATGGHARAPRASGIFCRRPSPAPK
jgi:hypothetical protein